MWRCFICGSDRACEHRERDLLLWYAKLFSDERPNAIAQVAAVPIERKPPARATEAAEAPAPRVRVAGGGE